MRSIGSITIAPPRGNTMKFIRRPDLTPQTRIHIVTLAWLNQGVYGKMTQIVKAYRISRTLLYQLLLAATVQLEVLFSEQHRLQSPAASLEPLALLLRLEGNCSIASISAILKRLGYQPNSVGHLSEYFQYYGQGLPSTLSMPSKTVVFYLGDEIFAIHTPILVTIEPQSTAMLRIELATDRSASTWKAHFETLHEHHFSSIGMASDRGVGLVAGYREAHPEALWVSDQFHEFHDLFNLRPQWERKAYSTIAKEDEAARKFHHAKSESNLSKRLLQYEQAQQACEQTIARYDQLDTLLQLLQEALQLCTSQGKLRTKEGVYSELIRWYLSGGGLLAIVHKRFMIRQFEDGFESQPGAPRSGIPLGVSPFGIDPQVTDHSVEGPTVPGSIAMTQGKKQLWQSIGGRHGSLACRDHYLKQMFSCMSQETFYC